MLVVHVLGLLLAGSLSLRSAERSRSALTEFMVQQGYEVIPLEYRKPNRLCVHARLRAHTLQGVIDTGATDTWLDRDHARKLKSLGEITGNLHSLFGQTHAKVERVAFDQIELGGLLFTNGTAKVLDLPLTRETHTGSWVSVPTAPAMPGLLLGMDFLTRYHALLNCRAPCAYIRRASPSKDTDAVEKALCAGGMAVVHLQREGCLLVSVQVNEHAALFMVDTGCEFTVVDWNQLAELDLNERQTVGEATDIARHKQQLQFTDVRSLRLGNCELKNLRVGVVSLKDTNSARALNGLSPIQGLLGPEVFYQVCAIIDCEHAKLFVSAIPRP